MGQSLNRFDKIAGVYDGLAALFFGKHIFEAQLTYLNQIPQGANVLIVGGGSGRLLENLFQLNPSCRVVYLEASSKMIALSKRRLSKLGSVNIQFIHGTERDLSCTNRFDVIITNFFLDMFSSQSLQEILVRLNARLSKRGFWIVTDFVYSTKLKHRILLKTMYIFFGALTYIEAKTLPSWEERFNQLNFEEVNSKYFFDGFIKGVLYRAA